MNCSQFGEVAHDVDRAGARAGPLWVEAISHAGECPSCSSLLDNSPAIQPPTATPPQDQAQAVPQQGAANPLNSPKSAQDSDAESAQDFVPLPDSFPLLPAEEASVVRVRMRRGSLNAFGLQVNEERAADLIQVEFLVAEDGTPRAVRYVR